VGNAVPRASFTNVTDYLSEATVTIKTLESVLPNMPEETPEERATAASLRGELQAAREARDQATKILQGDPSLMEAIDFVFLGS